MQQKTDKVEGSSEALKFFNWAYQDGGKMALDLDYVPLPAVVQNQVRNSWKQSAASNGQALWK
ncbi:hypothetical protein EGI20_18925 [Aquitalea sp. S1-19]|nr:hypothetical protein [Aquitalea sp. S1-19]